MNYDHCQQQAQQQPYASPADYAHSRLQAARAQLAAARSEFDAAMNAYWDVTMGPAHAVNISPVHA